MTDKPVPPYEAKQVLRECHLDGCDKTFKADPAGAMVWCSIAHRRADPEGKLKR